MKIPSRQQRRRGYALLVVIMQVMLMTALWGVAFRQLSSAIRLIQSQNNFTQSTDPGLKALTRGLILLETGSPPDGYTCIVAIPGQNTPFYIQVKYSLDPSAGGQGTGWKVEVDDVTSSTDPKNLPYPAMPYTFPPPS